MLTFLELFECFVLQAPRQLIHIQPFSAEQDVADYDMDSDDEVLLVHKKKNYKIIRLCFADV